MIGHRRLQLPFARFVLTRLFETGLLLTGMLLDRLFMTMAAPALVLMSTE
jgi:hypothetical protein